jgi:hypothetical protein
MLRRGGHGRVLNGTDDKMTFRTPEGARNAKQGEVVGLGRASGEYNFMATRADQRGDLVACIGYSLGSTLAKRVRRRRVAELLP